MSIFARKKTRVCVITASGMGRRMGGPKALLLWSPGLPLAVAHARLRREDCSRVFLVTRQPIVEMLACFDDELTFVVSNAPDELGPAGSIAAIVKSGKIDEADELLITPVDMPPISPHIVDQLCSALGSNALAARPVFGSRGGHPVLVRSSLIFDHYRISVPSLRDVLRGPGVGLVDVPVTDPDVIADLDTPEAFRTRRGMEPSFWPQ